MHVANLEVRKQQHNCLQVQRRNKCITAHATLRATYDGSHASSLRRLDFSFGGRNAQLDKAADAEHKAATSGAAWAPAGRLIGRRRAPRSGGLSRQKKPQSRAHKQGSRRRV